MSAGLMKCRSGHDISLHSNLHGVRKGPHVFRHGFIGCWSQVYLPTDGLQALIVSSVGDVTILPGFATPALTITSAFGYGDVYALGFDTQNLVTEISG
jgi:hypothetical protein